MYTLDDIKKEDQEIASAITDEFERQNSHIELIASENWVSPAVMSAMGSILTNKYAEGYPGRRYYGGCECVDEVEDGAVGEEKIAELQPDIVITDITMPVKSGLEMIADTREKFNYIAIILTGYSEFEYAQQAIRNGVSDYVLKPLDMDEMRTALEKAVRLAGDNQYLQQREDEAEAVRSRTALPPLSEDKVTDPLVLRIVAYLKENYQSKITLADLQEQFHYSERYINQKFQKELGTTVIDYLNRCRIQNALELIRKGKLPISQIGWECGIGEYKYFNHVFKKYIGCSVREYQSTLK